MIYIVLSVILGIVIVGLIIWGSIKISLKRTLGVSNLDDAIKNVVQAERESYQNIKSTGGLTKLLLPEIEKDFKDFNIDNFYSKVEKNISDYLNALTAKDYKKIVEDKDYIFVQDRIKNKIKNMLSNHIDEEFNDIKFHHNSIKSYTKNNGTATIKVSTSLGYYYETNKIDEKVHPELRKEAVIDTEYVYVYDETKFDNEKASFSLHCPNCGAPITDINTICSYCTSEVIPITFRAWKINKIIIK